MTHSTHICLLGLRAWQLQCVVELATGPAQRYGSWASDIKQHAPDFEASKLMHMSEPSREQAKDRRIGMK